MPGRGLEPLRISPPDPKSGASANSATPALGFSIVDFRFTIARSGAASLPPMRLPTSRIQFARFRPTMMKPMSLRLPSLLRLSPLLQPQLFSSPQPRLPRLPDLYRRPRLRLDGSCDN